MSESAECCFRNQRTERTRRELEERGDWWARLIDHGDPQGVGHVLPDVFSIQSGVPLFFFARVIQGQDGDVQVVGELAHQAEEG